MLLARFAPTKLAIRNLRPLRPSLTMRSGIISITTSTDVGLVMSVLLPKVTAKLRGGYVEKGPIFY